ncbi:MAG TPA: nuclear transport factor 2 family protein [Gemmatimonadota bacterium]|nr:nuclear transport factor 2 family protein [Gemmatimonadota bacterium]
MKRSILTGLLLLAFATPARAQAGTEEAAIRAALEHYLLGHATGDGAHHAMVFHDVANLYWIRDGELASRTSADYIAGAPGQPAENETERRREITMVDVTGDAAVAKIVLDYPDALITDYMSLLKVDGEWKIVNKIFTVERKAAVEE